MVVEKDQYKIVYKLVTYKVYLRAPILLPPFIHSDHI